MAPLTTETPLALFVVSLAAVVGAFAAPACHAELKFGAAGLFDAFVNPPREYTIIPFWFLNDDLTEQELIRQIDDFEAHGVYGFIPHARIGLPESIGYMSERWLHFVKVCVDHAAEKDMVVVLYDEGMYPSGSCAGQVVAANPRHATRCLQRREKGPLQEDEVLVAEDEKYMYVNRRSNGHIRGVHYGTDDGQPGAPPSADILNPESVASFFRLALDRQYDALKEHFGKTVIAVFTDEPDVLGRGHLAEVKPWTWGFEAFLKERLGYDFAPHLGALWDDAAPDAAHPADAARYRDDFARAVNARLEQVYYAPYSKWCDAHGVALTGHPAQPCDIGTEKYFQIPGQDIVWRYIEPFQTKSLEGEQCTMAKCSTSAQLHYGRHRNANECFGAYGWNFTEDEMGWVSNWLFVRGVNMLYPHAFYYSVRDERRNERPPDVGPNNVWWEHYKVYADYCRRMCMLGTIGEQVCPFAILGTPTSLPWRAARVMFESQRDFNYLDTETLRDRCSIAPDGICIGGMKYRALILDGPGFADADTLTRLKPLIDAGQVIAYADAIPEIPTLAPDAAALVRMLDAIVPPDLKVTPPTPDLRLRHMRYDGVEIFLFSNEGMQPVDVQVEVSAPPHREWWDPVSATVLKDHKPDHLTLPPYKTRILSCWDPKLEKR